MQNVKLVGSILPTNSKLSASQCLKSKRDKVEMRKIPYAATVESLMYSIVRTRPDIAYVVGTVNCYMSNPGKERCVAVKWMLRYLKGTSSVSLRYNLGKPVLKGCMDSNMLVDVDTNRSTYG